jgi:hypothetical protein
MEDGGWRMEDGGRLRKEGGRREEEGVLLKVDRKATKFSEF